jgi:hypothetical protein
MSARYFLDQPAAAGVMETAGDLAHFHAHADRAIRVDPT